MEEQKETPVGEVVKLTPFESQISELEELVKDYNNLVVTKENYKEMDEKRLILYRKRIAIQRDEKANTDALNKAKKLNSSKADTLIAIIKPKEDDLATKLKAIDDAIELAKQKELKRINDHKSIINSFGQKLIEVMKITDIEVLEDKKVKCLEWHDNYQAEEFEQELEGVVQSYVDTINGLVKILKSKKVEEPVVYNNAEPKQEKDLVDFGEETPYIVPEAVKPTQRPAFGGATERAFIGGSSQSDIKPLGQPTEPTLEERAKSGEFMTQVAANFAYKGYKFYIDPKLDKLNYGKVKDYLTGLIDIITKNEEVF